MGRLGHEILKPATFLILGYVPALIFLSCPIGPDLCLGVQRMVNIYENSSYIKECMKNIERTFTSDCCVMMGSGNMRRFQQRPGSAGKGAAEKSFSLKLNTLQAERVLAGCQIPKFGG